MGYASSRSGKWLPLLAAGAALLLHCQAASGVNYSTRANGANTDWNDNGRWSTGGCNGGSAGAAFPGSTNTNDTATLCTGHTTILNVSPANTIASLTTQGTGRLNIGNSGTGRTLTITGNVNVSNGGIIRYTSDAAHTLTIGGDLTIVAGGTFDVDAAHDNTSSLSIAGDISNAGTFNMRTGATDLCNVTFTGSGTQTVSGAGGTTQFNRIFINMAGATINNIVDVTATNFALVGTGGNGLNFTDGTFRLSTNDTISPFASAAFAIPANARLWVNNAGAIVNAALGGTIAANGVIQIDSGTFDATGAAVVVNGLLHVNGGTFDSSNQNVTAGATGTVQVDSGAFNSGTGNVLVNGVFEVNGGTASATGTAPFEMDGGTLRITGGVVTAGNAANENVLIDSNAASAFEMTGGTLNVAGRFTADGAAAQGSFTMSNGTITVSDGFTNTLNDPLGAPFFIGSGTSFTMSGGAIVIERTSTQANAREYDVRSTTSNVTGGTVQIGNAATPAAQTFQINSVPPVHNLTINTTVGSHVVTLMGDLTVRNILSLSSARLDASTFTLAVLSDCNVPSVTRTSGRVDLLGVGARLLMHYPTGAVDCTYPVGEGNNTNYLPVRVNFSSVATAGDLAVGRETTQHPDGANGLLNLALGVNRYWTFSGTTAATGPTLAGSYSATFDYLAAETDPGAAAANFVVARGTGCAGGPRVCGSWTHPQLAGPGTATQIAVQGLTIASGGLPTDFAVGEASRFAREDEFIYSREQY